MSSNRENKEFLRLVRAVPNFDFVTELDETGKQHGPGTLAHLQAIIDRKILSKDEACRLWANSIGIAYVDVLASAITEDAVLRIPFLIAKKIKVIGLYLIDDILTVALGTPEDKEVVRRLEQIVQTTVSPVFCLPSEIDDANSIQYSTEKTLTDSLAELERDNYFSSPDTAGSRIEQIA